MGFGAVVLTWRRAAVPPAQEIDPLEPIELELDPEEDGAVASWFYDDKPLQWTKFVNGPSYRTWHLPLPVVRPSTQIATMGSHASQGVMCFSGECLPWCSTGSVGCRVELVHPAEVPVALASGAYFLVGEGAELQ